MRAPGRVCPSLFVVLLSLGCRSKAAPPEPALLASASAASASAPVSAAPPASAAPARRVQPAERLAAKEKECEEGKGPSCYEASMQTLKGCGAKADKPRAQSLKELACARGDQERCFEISLAKLSTNDALPMSLDACTHGAIYACATAATYYHRESAFFSGRDSHPDAVKYAAYACDHGDARGCGLLAEYKTDAPEAERLALVKKACELDELHCAGYLATEVYEDPGSPEHQALIAWSRRRAFSALARRCEEGECTCGDAVLYGGEEIAPESARAYAKLGCDAEEKSGCLAMAELLEKGRGGPADAPAAAATYKKACDDDKLHEYCDRLAAMFEEGRGVAKDAAQAFHYAEKACAFDPINVAYCPRLVRYHARGLGTPKDAKKAFSISYQACTQDKRYQSKKACAAFKEIGIPGLK